jgi:hypothetical protein
MNAAAVGGPYTYPQSDSWVASATAAGLSGCTSDDSSASTCINCCTDTDVYPSDDHSLNRIRAYCTGNFN